MYDVIIIGAGYAGSRLSGLLSDFKDVLVIDKSGVGKKDVSVATFTKIIEDESVIVNEYEKYSIMTTEGDLETYNFETTEFALVDYGKLCKNEIGHDIVKCRVEEYGKNFVRLSNGEVLKSKLIVDCSGVGGYGLRKKFGINSPKYIISLSFCEINNSKFIEENTMYFILGYTNFGGWIYPISNKKSDFGFAIRHTSLIPNYPDLNGALELLGLEKTNCNSIKNSQYTFGLVKKVVKDEVVLFGDSAGLVHPSYMMGIHYVYRISPVLADSVIKFLKGDRKSLIDYQLFWKKMLKRASGNIARGYAVWDLPVKDQIKVAKIQMKSKIKPTSIRDHMWAIDDEYHVLGKNPPKLTDYPLRLYLQFLYHYAKIRFF